MPKARKKKVPITGPGGPLASSKPKSTRTVIRQYHTLLKEKAKLTSSDDAASIASKARVSAIEDEIEQLGGLEKYQRMSVTGQGKDRGGGSERIFISWLKDLSIPPSLKQDQTRLQSVCRHWHFARVLISRFIDYSKSAHSSQITTGPVHGLRIHPLICVLGTQVSKNRISYL
jgi:hypothetical protein